MRAYLLPVALMGLALAGCSKPSDNTSSTESPEPTAPEAGPENSAAKLAAVQSLPAPYNTGDPQAGKRVFAQCRSCHTITPDGADMTGPNLHGVIGRKAGSKPGYNYSSGMRAAGWIWDAPRLDKWLTSPKADIPDTKMTFLGLKDQKDRIDVIAYLKAEGG